MGNESGTTLEPAARRVFAFWKTSDLRGCVSESFGEVRNELRDSGFLTEAAYEAQKAKIPGSGVRSGRNHPVQVMTPFASLE